jgi:hypothetical protein
MGEARRLHDAAELLQGRRLAGGVDSAVFAHRALTLLLRLLLMLHGESVPEDFRELTKRARAIADAESLLVEDLGPDLVIVEEMRQRFIDGTEITAADERRYDRAFVRSSEWVRAVQEYLDQRLPPQESKLRRHVAMAFVALGIFVVGVVVGRHVKSEPTVLAGPSPAAPVKLSGPAFNATYFKDARFGEVALSRRDPNIAFNWEGESPADTIPSEHFSARWEGVLNVDSPGKYTFYLTSDDGSRMSLDNMQIIDNWGNHSAVMKAGTVDLTKGTHPILVEYFDEVGTALIKLEWSGDAFAKRLIAPSDLH